MTRRWEVKTMVHLNRLALAAVVHECRASDVAGGIRGRSAGFLGCGKGGFPAGREFRSESVENEGCGRAGQACWNQPLAADSLLPGAGNSCCIPGNFSHSRQGGCFCRWESATTIGVRPGAADECTASCVTRSRRNSEAAALDPNHHQCFQCRSEPTGNRCDGWAPFSYLS
jgi:hypothetical protein